MPIDSAATPLPSSADPERPAAANAAARTRVTAARARHWARTRRLTVLLLVLWLATWFGTVFFARDLAHLSVFGWPLSFYLAAQGSSLIYLAIIGAYAWRMRVLDRRFARMLEDAA
jgi:putative solute:sodium symporter small subunit